MYNVRVRMMHLMVNVEALWDEKCGQWVARSTMPTGLRICADTFGQLIAFLKVELPSFLATLESPPPEGSKVRYLINGILGGTFWVGAHGAKAKCAVHEDGLRQLWKKTQSTGET